jgi:serine/threonine-protein kinase
VNDSTDFSDTQHAPSSSASLARLRALFDRAIDVPAGARSAWIAENVADEEERAALQRLLAAADDTDRGFLDTPIGEHASKLTAEDVLAESLVGQRIGAFRLVRLLGKGGMAAVFLGTREDGDFRQSVAIKLLRRGLYSEIEQRLFLRERQVLASLNHPNIARLFDGGLTDAGVPYLVMEYVDGKTITRYAAEHALDVRERLDLFLTVCRAVEAAHRALIVHRDIKPPNILVAEDGTVKLLDFGIAKLLEDNVEGATVGIFTPDYAAPEQINAEAITTATDVYALGVLLHELLLGVRPGNTTRRPSTLVTNNAQTSAAGTTTAPAQLRKRLRGDLDNVLMKALEQDPEQRYASAGAFAEDIERHLAGQPVAAHPPSAWYRTRKFVSRHRGGVLTTAAFFLAILASLGIALWQTNVARRQAQVAREQAERADTTRQFLIGVFDQAEPDANLGKPITAKQLLDQGEQQLAAGADLQTGTRLDLTVLIAHLYWDLGDSAHAEPLLKQAAASAADPLVPDEVKARTLMTIAKIESEKRNFADALDHAKQAIAIAQRAGHVSDDSASEARRVIAMSLHGQDNSKEAEPFLRAALAADRALDGDHHQAVLDDWLELGSELTELSRFDEAVAALRNAVDLARSLHGPVHSSVANALQELASAISYAGNNEEGERLQREALGVFEKVYGAEHFETMTARGNLLWMQEHEGHYDEALRGRREGIELLERQATSRPSLVAAYYTSLGVDYSKLGQLDEAEKALRHALAIWAKLQGSNDEWDSADPMLTLADVLRWRGHMQEAESVVRHAIAIEEKHEPPSSGWLNRDRSSLADFLRMDRRYDEALREASAAVAARTGAKPDPIQPLLLARLSLAELDAGDATTARATAADSVAMARSVFTPKHLNLSTPLLALGRADLAEGHADEAEPLLREALAVRSPPFPPGDPRVVEVKVFLVEALEALGRTEESAAIRSEIEPLLNASRSPYESDLLARLKKPANAALAGTPRASH